MSNFLKKIFFALLAMVSIVSLGYTQAADTGSVIGDENPNWGSSVVASGPTANSFSVVFPVYKSNGEQITTYAISYTVGIPIAQADIPDIKKVPFEWDKVQIVGDTVTLVLDNLKASTSYSFVIIPINKEGTELVISNPVEVQTTAANAATDTTLLNDGSETLLGAADTASANFTYVVNDNKVTVKRQVIQGASKFAFSMKEAIDATYTNVGEELISKGSYTFVIGKKGLFTVKIVPIDAAGQSAWVERTLSIKIDAVTATPGKWTPATGAGLNLILMSTFLLMLIYVVYRFRTTK